jgi:hypothetical protein
MTHDELLAKLADDYQFADYAELRDEQGFLPTHQALRAVVELHKPYQHEAVSYVFCMGCTIDLDLAPPYPCETIQTIERELE